MKLRAFSIYILSLLVISLTIGAGEAITYTSTAEFKLFLPRVSGKAITYRLGTYYYPWYFDDFHGRQYLRKHLVPKQEPVMGEYNDRHADIIQQHLEWSRYAGIDLWVMSWWGPGNREDTTILNHILEHASLDNLKISIHYETLGRTNHFTDYSAIGSDIAYLADNYFNHPNYFKIDERPVLFVYLTRDLSYLGTLQSTLETIRFTAAEKGISLYIVGDHAYGLAPSDPGDIRLLDAITNYDVYGCMAAFGYATQRKVDTYYYEQSRWKVLADDVGVPFIPSVTPGFNDRGIRPGHYPLSRKLGPNEDFGSLFTAMIRGARSQTDSRVGHLIMITSWNEWHEDTQIEPVRFAAPTFVDDSDTGNYYTAGFSYEGYDQRYLQILRNEVYTGSR